MGIPIQGGFANVDDSFEPLPAGTYSATVFSGEEKTAGDTAKNPGSKYIAWEFNITEEGYEKRKAWLNTSLVEKALPMLKRFLKAVGYTDDELNDPDFQIEISDITGRDVRLVIGVGTNPNTGEANNSVKRVLPVNETADMPA